MLVNVTGPLAFANISDGFIVDLPVEVLKINIFLNNLFFFFLHFLFLGLFAFILINLSVISWRYRLHIIDLDPASVTSGGWLEDTSLVEKYTISEEAYNNLDGVFLQNFSPTCLRFFLLNLNPLLIVSYWKLNIIFL